VDLRSPFATAQRTSLAALTAFALWPPFAEEQRNLVAQTTSDVAAAADSLARVRGKVVDHRSGGAVAGAEVTLGHVSRRTDGNGLFSFREVLPGSHHLGVLAQGYVTMADTLEVSAGDDLDLVLPLSNDTVRLAPIVVTADDMLGSPRGYERRQRAGNAAFLVTRADIRERRPRYLSELLHGVPGGMVVPSPPHGYKLLLRAQCSPGIWVDGVEVPGAGSVDGILTPQDVEAMEVYHGFELPVEFGVDPCGGILVWTRGGQPIPARTSSGEGGGSGVLGRLAQVVIVAALVVLAIR
jgi:hypothetical protein